MKTKLLPLLTLSLALAACAHDPSTNKKVDEEVKAQPTVNPGGELAFESRKMIEENTALKPEQKQKLLALHASVAGDMKTIREEEGKLKMVFFRSLMDAKTPEKEIANLKKRIIDLDKKKMNRMFSALDEARTILGREDDKSRERVFRAFHFEGFGDNGRW